MLVNCRNGFVCSFFCFICPAVTQWIKLYEINFSDKHNQANSAFHPSRKGLSGSWQIRQLAEDMWFIIHDTEYVLTAISRPLKQMCTATSCAGRWEYERVYSLTGYFYLLTLPFLMIAQSTHMHCSNGRFSRWTSVRQLTPWFSLIICHSILPDILKQIFTPRCPSWQQCADVTCWALSILHPLWLLNGKRRRFLLRQPSFSHFYPQYKSHNCFDTVGWATRRASGM